MNFFTDAVLQPICTALVELTLWLSLFKGSGQSTIGGFSREFYLTYVLWSAFLARITANWSYEFKMMEEIESGSINSLLVRPMSFYEYYLSQLLGYKFITSIFSLVVPLLVILLFQIHIDWVRLPLALLLVTYYLFFVHALSFCVSMFAFHLTRVQSITVAKNLAVWLLSGELFPLDLLPEPFRTWFISLPFCNAVYIPVGFVTGRFGYEPFLHGFVTTTYGLVTLNLLAYFLWKRSIHQYTGTGA